MSHVVIRSVTALVLCSITRQSVAFHPNTQISHITTPTYRHIRVTTSHSFHSYQSSIDFNALNSLTSFSPSNLNIPLQYQENTNVLSYIFDHSTLLTSQSFIYPESIAVVMIFLSLMLAALNRDVSIGLSEQIEEVIQ